MVTAEGTAKEFAVPSLPAVLGRAEDVKIRIPLASVSRRHCELLEDDDDELVVRDLNSSNGIYVNGERVKKRELVPGDLLAIGPVVFVIRIDGHPKDIDATMSYNSGIAGSGGAGGSGARSAISGVPTWSGMGNPAANEGSKGGSGAAPAATPAPRPTPAPAPAPKPAKKKDDDDIDSILGDLSESDFDIDFSDLDDDKPGAGPKGPKGQ